MCPNAIFVTENLFRIKLIFLLALWISSQICSAYLADVLIFFQLFFCLFFLHFFNLLYEQFKLKQPFSAFGVEVTHMLERTKAWR